MAYVETYVCAYIQAVGLLRWGKQRTFQKGSTLSSILNKRTRGERAEQQDNSRARPECAILGRKRNQQQGANEGGGGGQAERSLEAAGGQL